MHVFWVCVGTGLSLPLLSTGPSTIHVVVCGLAVLTVVWPSLGLMKFIMPSDLGSSSVVCFGSTVLALFDSIVWFVSGGLSSGVPGVLESVNVCDSTMSVMCAFAREGCVGGFEYAPGTRVLWKKTCETACSGV